MKLQINRESFTSSLSEIQPYIPASRTVHEVLKGLHIQRAGSLLVFTASDLNISAKAVLNDIQGGGDFSIVINPTGLLGIVSSLTSEVLKVEITGKKFILSDKHRSYRFPILDAKFVEVPFVSQDLVLDTDAASFRYLLRLANAVAPTDSVKNLNCVRVFSDGKIISVSAIDSSQGMIGKLSLGEGSPMEFYLTREAVSAVGKYDSRLRILMVEGAKIRFDVGGSLRFIVNGLTTQFPDLTKLPFESKYPYAVSIDRAELLSSVGRLLYVMTDPPHPLLFKVSNNLCQISCGNRLDEREGLETVKVSGDVCEWSLSGSSLKNILEKMVCKKIRFEFDDEYSHPIRIVCDCEEKSCFGNFSRILLSKLQVERSDGSGK